MTRLSRSSRQANGHCTRIRVTDDCISLDVDHPGARCTPCKNKIDEMLGTRKKKKKDGGLYQERHFLCWKPWVIKEKMTGNQCHAYELAWVKLEKQGYPRCLQTAAVLETSILKVEDPKKHGENDVSVVVDQGEEPNNKSKPPPSVTPSKIKQTNGSNKDPPASNKVQDVSTQEGSKNAKYLSKRRLAVSSVERLMVTRFNQDNPVIRTLQEENKALRSLVMEAVAKLHQREEHMPVLQASSIVGASAAATVPMTSPDATSTTTTNEVAADDDEGETNKTREPTVTDLQEYLNPTRRCQEDEIETSYFRKIYGPAYAKKEKDAAAYQRLKKQVNKTKYHGGSALGKRLYGAAVALNPQSSFKALELTFALSHAALLADAGVNLVKLSDLAYSVPSASTLSEFVADAATDSKFVAAEEILEEGAKVFLICDKGALKTANAHFVKILAWYSSKEQRVKMFLLDTEDTDGHSNECADAIKHSLLKIFGSEDKIIAVLYGQMTDSGGGGVGRSLYVHLDKHSLCIPGNEYLTGYCTLHCLQLTIANGILTVLGKGGKKNETDYFCTALQLLHGVYNLQKYHETSEWKKIWMWAADKIGKSTSAPKKVPAPVLTRWWTVGVCAAFALEHWDIVLAICHGVIQKYKTSSALNQIASATQALMKTNVIKCDVELIYAYDSFFFNKHFEWLQRGDEDIGSIAGFLSRHLPVRYFVMHSELSDAYDMEGWKTMNAFTTYVECISRLPTPEKRLQQEKKTNLFFMRAVDTLQKHFRRWVRELLFLCLFSEAKTGGVVARYLFPNIELTRQGEENELHESTIHSTKINLTKFAEFLSSECGDYRNEIILMAHVATHRTAIQMVANDHDMWAATPHPILAAFRQHYLNSYAAFPSNSQMAESNIKDANYCQIPGRNEKTSSMFATARAGLVGSILQNSKEAFQKQTKIKGNKYMSGGKYGERIAKSDGGAVEEKKWQMRVEGRIKSEESIKFITERNKQLESLPVEKQQRWNQIRDDLYDNDQQFAKKRVEVKFEEYCESYDKNKALNKLQRRAGESDVMPIVIDRVPYGLLLKDRDTDQIKMELEYRGLATDGGWRDQLLKRLKQEENNTKDFLPQCPNVDFSFVWEADQLLKT
jgi:hypothetical protein